MTSFKRLSQRERRIGVVTLGLAAAAALYAWVAEPVFLEWLSVHRRAEAAEADLRHLERLMEHREAIEEDYARLRGAVTAGNSEQALKVALLSEVDRLVGECGLSVASVKPTTVAREGLFQRYGMELQVHCEAHKFLEVLQKMQEPQHLLQIEALSIAVGPAPPPLTVTLTISKLAKLEDRAS